MKAFWLWLEKEIEKIPEYLASLDASQKLNVLTRLIPYVIPKTTSVSVYKADHDGFKDHEKEALMLSEDIELDTDTDWSYLK